MADAPLNSSARALAKPRRGTDVPEGAVIFGADYASSAKAVELVGQRTEFEAGSEVAWRVALPAARGGESVRVTLTTEDGTETQVDNFVAMAGWNVYFGKSMLTVEPGTYVLHYLYDGHEVGSGTFTLS